MWGLFLSQGADEEGGDEDAHAYEDEGPKGRKYFFMMISFLVMTV